MTTRPRDNLTTRPTDNLDTLRHIEGFPIGEDEDLHALSDPPHYTAYPNPHIVEFIEQWGKPYDEPTDDYHREPYVADVSEGKRDPIYNAHSYHTKVPYKAIMRFIEHYTGPGDIVFDGFCGTGMTGIAAQMLGRRAILGDLSPAATFIAYNYNTPVDVAAFEREAKRILREVEAECGWMYETWHPHCDHPNRVKGAIRYTVWADVFVCPYCRDEMIFSDAAVDPDTHKVRRRFPCPGCGAEVIKRDLARAAERVWDSALGREIERARQVPVLINYSVGRERYEKEPDAHDRALIRDIEEKEIPYRYPTHRMPEGDESRRNDPMGITHVHHYYTRRNLWILAAAFEALVRSPGALSGSLIFTFEQAIMGMSKWARYVPRHYSQVNQGLSGTLYIASQVVEASLRYIIAGKIKRLVRVFRKLKRFSSDHALVSTQSATDFSLIPAHSIDYLCVKLEGVAFWSTI